MEICRRKIFLNPPHAYLLRRLMEKGVNIPKVLVMQPEYRKVYKCKADKILQRPAFAGLLKL